MIVQEDPRFSREYLEPDKRSIANAVQVFFNDGTKTEKVEIEYPIGHRRRRAEGLPLLVEKFEHNVGTRFKEERLEEILQLFEDSQRLQEMAVDEFVEFFVTEK